jgi:hypothetical protein
MDSKYLLENSTDFFRDTHQYFDLRRKFGGILPWVDMIVGPLVTIVSFFIYGTYDAFSALSFLKASAVFLEWLEYKELSRRIVTWKQIVRANGGPVISTNDPEYHVFVYADAMQRFHNSTFRTNCRVLPQNH